MSIQEIAAQAKKETVGDATIDRFSREYLLMNGEESVKRSIAISQDVVLGFSGMAGTQDEVAATGGVRFLTSKGDVVPQLNPVPLSDKAKRNLEKGVRILRIGLTEPAEDTLAQVFMNSILNSARDQISAWGQISVLMLNALIRGDVVELGRLANAAVPLREQMAPVSVNAIVLRALEKIKKKYGATIEEGGAGFSYGITGARSTGSVLLFFDPRLDESKILAIIDETAQEVKASIAKTGKMMPVEEDPHAFSQWRISEEGTRVRLLDPDQMKQYSQEVVGPQRDREQVQREANRLKRTVQLSARSSSRREKKVGLIQQTNFRICGGTFFLRLLRNYALGLIHRRLSTDKLIVKKSRNRPEKFLTKNIPGF